MRNLIPLLSLLLLGAACNPSPPPPPSAPPAQDPPAAGPLALRLEDFTLVWRNTDPNLAAQVYVGPAEGGWLEYAGNLWPNNLAPFYAHPSELRLRQGRIEVWGQDVSHNRVYGGRRFRWLYHFRFDDAGLRPRLVFPDGPVAFEVLERFPWGDQPPQEPSVIGALRTTSLVGGMQLCVREEWTPTGYTRPLRKGLLGYSFLQAGSRSVTASTNYLLVYKWFDGRFMGRPVEEIYGPLSLGGNFNDPNTFDPGPTPHSLVLIAKSEGNGQYRQPWERRWFRVYNRGFGAWPDPAEIGGVRCAYGEGWQVEEVTDPAEIDLMEAYERTRPQLFSELDPRLCPRPWRRGGSCATR